MLAVFTPCQHRSEPQIDYRSQFEAIVRNTEQILIEARNHNQTVEIDWNPVLSKMEQLFLAMRSIESTAINLSAAELSAAERLNASFLGVARSINDFASVTMEASTALLRVESDQSALISEVLAVLKKPVVIDQTFGGYWEAGPTGGSLLIPEGAAEIQIQPFGCYSYEANGRPRKAGHSILREAQAGKAQHDWFIKIPAFAQIFVEYTGSKDLGEPEIENMRLITKEELATEAPNEATDQVLQAAIEAANAMITNENIS